MINRNTPEYWNKQWSGKKRKFPTYTMNIVCWLIPEGSSVLDIGCGNGKFLRQVKEQRKPSDLFGIDISPVAIQRLNDSEIEGEVWSAENLDDFDRRFDVVVATHLFEHIENDVGLAKNVARIAKKMALIAVPNDCSYPEETGEHVRKYNLETLSDLFKNDFKEIKNRSRTNTRMLKNHLIIQALKC